MRKRLARAGIGLICRLVGRLGLTSRSEAYRWLGHFLTGDGSDRSVPVELVAEAITQEDAVWHGDGEPFKPSSDTRLFWLVGTFSFRLEERPDGYWLVGVDRYDWHANNPTCAGCGHWGYTAGRQGDVCPYCGQTMHAGWWWTDTGLPGRLVSLVSRLWPEAADYVDRGHRGTLSVSTAFWPWIGGREFDTRVEAPLSALPEQRSR